MTTSYLVYVTLRGRVVGQRVPVLGAIVDPATAIEAALKALTPEQRKVVAGVTIRTVK